MLKLDFLRNFVSQLSLVLLWHVNESQTTYTTSTKNGGGKNLKKKKHRVKKVYKEAQAHPHHFDERKQV